MNIIAFADLHLHFIHNNQAVKFYTDYLQDYIKNKKIDMVLIAGDIVESSFIKTAWIANWKNPHHVLRTIFNLDESIPIVCCLGNHEFAHKNIKTVLDEYKADDGDYNVHYLDICGHYTKDNVNIIGNVFWYDNSLKSTLFAKDDFIVSNWLDSSISDFIPSKACEKCKQQILNNIDTNKINIMLTHCVPHKKMNWFSIYDPLSMYNQYSGSADFLENEIIQKYVSWSISGHTHQYLTDTIGNINCVNIGNEYWSTDHKIKFFEFEV